jgi:hypothetical protein
MRRRRDVVTLLASCVLIAGVVVIAAAPSDAAPSWTISPTPSPAGPQYGTLRAVACRSTSMCFAVGNTDEAVAAQRWNGSSWIVTPIPTPANAMSPKLFGIACPGPTSCFAVGSKRVGSPGRVLLEHWNGTHWSIVSGSPATNVRGSLASVSCPAANRCFAVGVKSGDGIRSLIEHWNGTVWSVVPSPNLGNTTSISDVSCTTPANCVAVGFYTAPAYKALALRWNGSRWSTMALPTPSGTKSSLSGVACVTATRCFAVGSTWQDSSFNRKTLVEEWDGRAWSKVASPSRGSNSSLNDVSCSGPKACLAVGTAGSGLAERWNGQRWSIVPFPAGRSTLGVSCSSSAMCFAVGGEAHGTAIGRWNGTAWRTAAAPTGGSQSSISRIACASASQCLTIGEFWDGTQRRSLAEKWNGSSWSYERGPTRPAGARFVTWNDLECPSVTSCIAIGSYSVDSTGHPLAERWNGSTWTTLSFAQPAGATSVTLEGLTCTSATSCHAVGSYLTASAVTATLVEHWNGTGWSVVPSPNPPGAAVSRLRGVSCPSATNCVAVGYSDGVTLIEHWNGSTWTIVPSPNHADGNGLDIVSCASATSCLAVGTYAVQGRTFAFVYPFALSWDGSSWSNAASPDDTGLFADPRSIACIDAANCFVVGIAGVEIGSPNGTVPAADVQQWSGSSWSQAPLPTPAAARYTTSFDLACVGATCFMAGSYTTPTSTYPLIERYA